MVSIPDWSRFGRPTEVQQDRMPPGERYRKQREREATKQAEDSGYITHVDRKFIETHILGLSEQTLIKQKRAKSFLCDTEEELDLSNVYMVRLPSAHLRTVGEIGQCQHISICILNNNFVLRFDALEPCRQLVKLDLHGNQIQHVPTASFWASKPYLRILNLHDNPIGSIETLHHLSACPALHALSLNDTPLSLKRNYRHHVVNSIWSLKALDSYVVSDEEIIEDAEFDVHFATMHPNFAINLCPRSVQNANYEDEMRTVMQVMSEINRIQSHNSPVLIIQRYFRGYLTRKRLMAVADTRTWLSKKRSAKSHSWKNSPETVLSQEKPPPPPSPAEASAAAMKAAVVGGEEGSVASTRLDYDTYMAHRRPGSTLQTEEATSVQLQDELSASSVDKEMEAMRTNRLPGTPVSEHGVSRLIYVNLAKLEMGTLQSLHDDAAAMESAVQSPRLQKPDDALKLRVPSRRSKKKKADTKKRRVIKDVREFFGPVIDSSKVPEPEEAPPIAKGQQDDEELPVIDFKLRLKGVKQRVKYYDPMTDMIVGKRDAGRVVRAAEYNMHEFTSMQPEPFIANKSQPNAEKRIFNRVQGTMGFSCLRAVEQAYKDRAKAEQKVRKLDFVMNMKDQKEAAKERVRLYNDERRSKTLKEREKEAKKTAEVLEKRELQRIGYIDKSTELRNKSCNFKQNRRGELTFISDFNAQNTSVSNALLRHDRLARREDKQQTKNAFIQDKKVVEQEQKDVVTKYLEHRRLMRQTESALGRAALDTKMLQEATDRHMQAKARVEHQKQLSRQATLIVPPAATFILPPVAEDKKPAVDHSPLDRWGTGVYVRVDTGTKPSLSRQPATALT